MRLMPTFARSLHLLPECANHLESFDWYYRQCLNCNCPEMEYRGNSDTGPSQVSCSECGARHERMTRSKAISVVAMKLADAMVLGQRETGQRHYQLLVMLWNSFWTTGAPDMVWILTRPGSPSDEIDETPF